MIYQQCNQKYSTHTQNNGIYFDWLSQKINILNTQTIFLFENNSFFHRYRANNYAAAATMYYVEKFDPICTARATDNPVKFGALSYLKDKPWVPHTPQERESKKLKKKKPNHKL